MGKLDYGRKINKIRKERKSLNWKLYRLQNQLDVCNNQKERRKLEKAVQRLRYKLNIVNMSFDHLNSKYVEESGEIKVNETDFYSEEDYRRMFDNQKSINTFFFILILISFLFISLAVGC